MTWLKQWSVRVRLSSLAYVLCLASTAACYFIFQANLQQVHHDATIAKAISDEVCDLVGEGYQTQIDDLHRRATIEQGARLPKVEDDLADRRAAALNIAADAYAYHLRVLRKKCDEYNVIYEDKSAPIPSPAATLRGTPVGGD